MQEEEGVGGWTPEGGGGGEGGGAGDTLWAGGQAEEVTQGEQEVGEVQEDHTLLGVEEPGERVGVRGRDK